MAWFIPAIMALGHGAATAASTAGSAAGSAGAAIGHGAAAAGEAAAHGAEAVGSEIGKGAESLGHDMGFGGGGGASMPAGGASPTAGGVAAPAPVATPAAKPAPGFMKSTMQNAMKDQINGGFSSVLGAGMKSSPVAPAEQGQTIQNPISGESQFSLDSSMPSAIMPAGGQRGLSDTLLRNGG